MAKADGVCVPREAMLLLALRYAFGIERDKSDPKKYVVNNKRIAKLISCPTGEASITSQYVIYIEGKYFKETNKCIKENFDLNVLKLRQWGFDFIYMPSLVEEFSNMNPDYVKAAVNYIAPEIPCEKIDRVYNRLLNMDTVKFCNYVLAEKLNVEEVKNSEPSLLINIGTSFVPYCSINEPVVCYTEFLFVPLEGDINVLIDDFINAFSRLVSFYTVSNTAYLGREHSRFKFFGFYKAIFDFLLKAEPNESDMVIHPWNDSLEFPQIGLDDFDELSPQQAAIYKLILELTYNHPLAGLPTAFANITQKEEIETKYKDIYHNRKANIPDNLAPIITRIRNKFNERLRGLANRKEYIPMLRNGKYSVSAPPERIKISKSHEDDAVSFIGYQWEKA